jgi:hypothetical protein
VPNRKNLARDFDYSTANQARGTKTAMHLRRFEDCRVQFSDILLKLRQPVLQLGPL